MPTVVAFPDTAKTFRIALHEILVAHFDGLVHDISDINITFPVADIISDGRPIPSTLTRPAIVLIGEAVINRTKYKCTNPLFNSKHGYEIRADVVRNVIVVVPAHGGQNDKSRKIVD